MRVTFLAVAFQGCPCPPSPNKQTQRQNVISKKHPIVILELKIPPLSLSGRRRYSSSSSSSDRTGVIPIPTRSRHRHPHGAPRIRIRAALDRRRPTSRIGRIRPPIPSAHRARRARRERGRRQRRHGARRRVRWQEGGGPVGVGDGGRGPLAELGDEAGRDGPCACAPRLPCGVGAAEGFAAVLAYRGALPDGCPRVGGYPAALQAELV